MTKSGNAWVVGGFARLSHVREVTGLDLHAANTQEAAATVNDWVIEHLGAPVEGGEIVSANGVQAIVRKVRRQRVLEAQIAKRSVEES